MSKSKLFSICAVVVLLVVAAMAVTHVNGFFNYIVADSYVNAASYKVSGAALNFSHLAGSPTATQIAGAGTLSNNITGNAATASNVPIVASGSAAGCTVGTSAAWLTCSTTVTWANSFAFADSNYNVTCSGYSPTGGYPSKLFINGISSKSTTSVTVLTGDAGNSGDTYTTIYCIAIHP